MPTVTGEEARDLKRKLGEVSYRLSKMDSQITRAYVLVDRGLQDDYLDGIDSRTFQDVNEKLRTYNRLEETIDDRLIEIEQIMNP